MAKVIKIKKGLDIRLSGSAPRVDVSARESGLYGVVPEHFHGFKPRLCVQVGDRVQAGSAVLQDKNYPEVLLTSPVSGTVSEVVRGEKRKILYVSIQSDGAQSYVDFDTRGARSADEVRSLLLQSGLFALIRQRPYDRIADPSVQPRDIFVTGSYTAPLMPDALEIVQEDRAHLQLAADALRKLTSGKVYLGLAAGKTLGLEGVEEYQFDGPHPSGNVGVQINHIAPINKGETVWTLSLSDLALIGRFMATGHADYSRKIVLAGSRLSTAGYTRVILGAEIEPLVADKYDSSPSARRIIDGDVLTGHQVCGGYRFMSPRSHMITVISEGSDVHDMFGWATPGLGKFSMSRAFPAFLASKKRTYDIDARVQGGKRAIIVSNEYDRVFPLDIFPEQLIKSVIAYDIDKMEQLGIYEVAPEDFALCEFVDTSKLELQYIIRQGLDMLYKEMN